MLVFICLFSCNLGNGKSNTNNNNGSEKESIDYTTAEKVAGKTFSYFTQDVEAGDEAVLFKKSIGFGKIDKTSNTIALEIKDFKGNESTSVYDIKTNSIDGKVLDVSGLDKAREFDKEFVFDGFVFENCGQKMKWAKLLEGNTYEHTVLIIHDKQKFYSINTDNMTIKSLGGTGSVESLDNSDLEYTYYIETQRFPYSSKDYSIENITESKFLSLTN